MSNFSALYPTIRVMLGDIDELCPGYSNGQLDMGIGVALLLDGEMTESTLGASGSGRTITPDVTDKDDILRISVRAAIAMLSPSVGNFSWRSRVLSVTRNNNAHLQYLIDLERKAVDGGFTFYSESEWDQFCRGTSNVTRQLASIRP